MELALSRSSPDSPAAIIIFPEGTRSRNGALQGFKSGAAFLASKLQLPVVPAYVAGTHASMPKGCIIPGRERVRITFGRPLEPPAFGEEGLDPEGRKQRLKQFTLEIQASVQGLEAAGHTAAAGGVTTPARPLHPLSQLCVWVMELAAMLVRLIKAWILAAAGKRAAPSAQPA